MAGRTCTAVFCATHPLKFTRYSVNIRCTAESAPFAAYGRMPGASRRKSCRGTRIPIRLVPKLCWTFLTNLPQKPFCPRNSGFRGLVTVFRISCSVRASERCGASLTDLSEANTGLSFYFGSSGCSALYSSSVSAGWRLNERSLSLMTCMVARQVRPNSVKNPRGGKSVRTISRSHFFRKNLL